VGVLKLLRSPSAIVAIAHNQTSSLPIFLTSHRLSWIEACPSVIDKLASHGYLVSGGGVAPVMEEVVSTLIDDDNHYYCESRSTTSTSDSSSLSPEQFFPSGLVSKNIKNSPTPPPVPQPPVRPSSSLLEAFIAPLCSAYARKSAVLVASLRENGFEVAAEPRGGFFVWARLPPGCPYGATALLSFAETNHQVSFLPGPRCRPKDEDKASANDVSGSECGGSGGGTCGEIDPAAAEELDRWVRLCFAMLDETQLKEGAGRLAAACRP